jgi:predicted phosphodiesterase
MKIAVASDLHLEFGDLDFDNPEGAEVLILSGDILVAQDLGYHDSHNIMGEEYRSNRYHNFMQRCTERFPHVIYILGNHEHYHGDFAETVTHLKNKFDYMSNLHILDNEILQISDVTFIGGTLWTDMNREDPTTLYHMKSMMNDFRCVRNTTLGTNAKFLPEDAVEEHRRFVGYIQEIIQGKFDQKFVVVGHHSPSRLSTHPRYADDTIMNGGYSSSLDDYIIDHPQIKLWTHGHTHYPFDYMIGSTRVVCNPRGYINYEESADRWQLITVDI